MTASVLMSFCDQQHELPIWEIHGQTRQWAELFNGEDFCVLYDSVKVHKCKL